MFKFSAPLVKSWRYSSKANKQVFTNAFKPWQELITWINKGLKHVSRLTANLLGLILCADRF
jgi:hypothetical protein